MITIMKKAMLLFALTLLLCLPATAEAQTAQAMTPALPKPSAGSVSHITILKKARRMYLLDAAGNIVREYPISLGGDPVGDKMKEGDGKTPEGKYKIDFKNSNSEYYRSLRISYPNKSDLWRAKKLGVNPGGNIFIHGQPNGKSWMFWKYNNKNDWTFGCIAVSNREIEEIWELVNEGTTVLIKP